MASLGKITNKRSQEHPKPYERPKKSLLGRVGETVRDILTPSFLKIKPYAKPLPAIQKECNFTLDHSESVCSQQIEVEMDGFVATFDSSIIGEDTSSAKLPNNLPAMEAAIPSASQNNESLAERLTSSQCQNNTHMSATPLTSAKARTMSRGSHSYTQPLMGQRGEKHTMNQNANSNDDVNAFASEPRNKRYRLGTVDEQSSVPSPLRPSLSSTIDTRSESYSLNKRSSLWSSPLTAVRLNKPAFNITTFCTSNDHTRNDLSVLSRSYQESPFYRGRTTYGGAAASNKQSTVAGSPYHMVSSVAYQRVKVKPAGQLDGKSGIMSSTARRIYEAIERTSPTEERTSRWTSPANVSALDSPLSFSASVYRRNTLQSGSGNDGDAKKGPPVKDLPTATVNLIAQSRSAFAVSGQAVSQSTESRPVVIDRETNNRTVGGGGKMKRDHSKHYSVHRELASDDAGSSYSLPSHVSLLPFAPAASISLTPTNPISTVLSVPTIASSSSNCVPQTSVWGTAGSDSTSVSVVHGSLMSSSATTTAGSLESTTSLRFNLPVDITDRPSSNKLQADSTFIFSQPLSCRTAVLVSISSSLGGFNSHCSSSSTSIQMTSPSKNTTNPTITSPATQTTNSKLSELKFNLSAAVKKKTADDVLESSIQLSAPALKKGSVLDILGSKTSVSGDKSSAVQQSTPPKSGSADSSFSNRLTVSDAASTPTGSASVQVTSEQPSLSEMFKQRQAPGSWSCNECYVTNKATDDSCVACCTLKPGASESKAQSNSMAAPTSTSGASAFKFGAGGGFTFKSSDTSSAATSSFKFGAETVTSSSGNVVSSTSSSGSMLFGKVTAVTAPLSMPQETFGGFLFGQVISTTASTTSPLSTSDSTTEGVQFGTSTKESSKNTINTLSFTASAVQTTASSSKPFGFGMSTTTTLKSVVSSAEVSGFVLASSTTASSTLSVPINQPDTGTAPGLFKFGGGTGISSNSQPFSASLPVSSNAFASTKSDVLSGTPFVFNNTAIPLSVSAAATSQLTAPSAASSGKSDMSSQLSSMFTASIVKATTSEIPPSVFMFGQQSSVSDSQRPLGVAATPTSVFQFGSTQQQASNQSSVGVFGTSTSVTSAPASALPKFGSVTTSSGAFGSALGVQINSFQSPVTSVASFGSSLTTGAAGGFKFAPTSQPSFTFGGVQASVPAFTAGASSAPVFGASAVEPALSTLNGKVPTFGKPDVSLGAFMPSSASTTLPTVAFGTSVSSSTGFSFAGTTASPFAFGASTSKATTANATSSSSNSASLFTFGKSSVTCNPPTFGQGAPLAFGSAVASFVQPSAVSAPTFAPSGQSSSKTTANSPFGQPSVFGSVSSASQQVSSVGFAGFGHSAPPVASIQQPFGQTGAQQPFGQVGSQQPFGQTGTQQPFGQVGSQQPFGQTGTQQPFGQSAFGSSNLQPFGTASQNVFGQSDRSNVFAFGASGTPASLPSASFGVSSNVMGSTLGKRSGANDAKEDASTKKLSGFESFGAGQSSGGMFGASAGSVPAFGAPAASAFSFGAQQQQPTAWNGQTSNSNPSSFSIPSSFNFTQQQPTQQQQQQPFQFAADTSAVTPGNRIIKKATRKLPLRK